MGRVTMIVLSAALLAFMLMVLASRRAAEPPVLRSPVDGAKLVVGSGVPPYVFRWRHGNHLYRHPIRWRRVNYFVVCLKEDLPGDLECLYPDPPSQSEPPWARLATDIPSTTAAPGSRFENAVRNYTFTVDNLPRSYLDRDLMWTAAACASQASRSCSYAVPPHRFRILGRNLIGRDMSERSFAGTTAIELGFIFENDGPNDTGQFDFEWRVVQMMPDTTYNPRRDVNASDIDPNTDRVMRISTGTVVLINTLPQVSAGYDNSDVWGILERNGFEQSNIETHSGLSPTSADRVDRTVTVTGVTVGSSQVTSIGMSLIMDPSNALQEINEADNVHVKEESYFF